MILTMYRSNGEGGGCHCHGPDYRWDSTFETAFVASFEEAKKAAADFVASQHMRDEGPKDGSDYKFVLVVPATPEQIEEAEFNPPKFDEIEGWVEGGLVKFEFDAQSIVEPIRLAREAEQAKAREEERKRRVEEERKAAEAKAAEERATYERLHEKFGPKTTA